MYRTLRLPTRLREAGVTEREADVLVALADGLSNAEIAGRLFISERTVESHVSSLRRKLGVWNRAGLGDLGRTVVVHDLVPLPPPLARPRVFRFIGRRAERETLVRAWKDVSAGDRRTALVAGEPGIGKTRLAAEVAGSLHEDEAAVVLYGRCDEDLGVPYQPFVEALRHFVGHAAGPTLSLHLGRYAGELVRLAPELAEVCPGLSPPFRCDPESERYRLFDAVAAWLGAASVEAPVLLVLDDLHWATKPTLLLARHVLRSSEPLRLLTIGTYRDTELPRHHPLSDLLADFRNQEGVERLTLTGFDETGVAEYLEAAAGRELDDEDRRLAHAIHVETEGNPFFVGEMLRHLDETGAVSRRDGRWTATSAIHGLKGIPAGVREVVGRRLSRLSDSANRLLAAAAVIGDEFELDVMRASSRLEEDAVLAALDEATSARLVVEVPCDLPRYRFAHALVRATLYDELSAARRRPLHQRVGEAIETIHADRLEEHFPALAYHFSMADREPGTVAKALEYTWRAGDRALALLAHDEAARYYLKALGLLGSQVAPDTGAQHQELLIAAGEAQRRAGDPSYRETLLEAARLAQQRGDAEALARAALTNSRGIFPRFMATVDVEQVAVLEAALAATGPAETPVRARLLAALALELLFGGAMERRLRLADEALVLARRLDDPATLAQVLLARYWTVPRSALAERFANADEALRLSRILGDPVAESWALSLRFRAAMEAGNVSEADRSFEQNEVLVTELGQPGLQWVVAVQRAGRALLAGRIDDAERLAGAAYELGQSAGQLDARLFFVVELFATRFEQGRAGEVQPLLFELAGTYRTISPIFRTMSAVASWEAGKPEEARLILHRESAEGFEGVATDVTWLAALCLFAVLTAALDDHVRAHALTQRLAPYAALCPTLAHGGVVLGSVAYYLGLLAYTLDHYDEAEAHFIIAAATHRSIGAPAWLARTRLEWARTLLARGKPGDAERAQQLLHQALASARELRLVNIERRAVTHLA